MRASTMLALVLVLGGCGGSHADSAADSFITSPTIAATAEATFAGIGAPEAGTMSALPLPPSGAPAPASATNLTVVLDPGHGGDEVGAADNGVVEKDSNLELALRVERLLVEAGARPVLTRRTDTRGDGSPAGSAVTGWPAQRLDLQARIDLANSEGAAIFVSMHSNGSSSAAERGVEVYYNGVRPFASENARLAELLRDGVMSELGAAGYDVPDRGIKDDRCLRAFQGRCFPLFVLGPERTTTLEEATRRGRGADLGVLGFGAGTDSIQSRATAMPGALVELLFISSPQDATMLRDAAAREAMARGIALGIARYLGLATPAP